VEREERERKERFLHRLSFSLSGSDVPRLSFGNERMKKRERKTTEERAIS
jgi:hypothetical protein